MAFSLTWLPQVLQDKGLKVTLTDGWETRGVGDVEKIMGVICHHTATPVKTSNMPTLDTLIHGRPDLQGPLSQLGLGRDGTYYVVAAGKCNHAGQGSWKGVTTGNLSFIGIEAENTGLPDDSPWPAVQMDAYHRGVAAILAHIGQPVDFCAGHKEYALPPGRKSDPSFDMVAFRSAIATILNGSAPAPIAAQPPVQPATPTAHPALGRGATGELVKQIQAKLGVTVDGAFGPETDAAVRAFQQQHGLTVDGIVGPQTWAALG